MKKHFFFTILAVFIFPVASFCQYYIGSKDLHPTRYFSKKEQKKIDSVENAIPKIDSTIDDFNIKNEKGESESQEAKKENYEKIEDTLLQEKDSLEKSKDSSSNLTVMLFGQGTLANIENLTAPNANLSIGASIQLGNFTTFCSFNARPASSNDSSVVYKNFLFPEINARAFILGFDYNLNKKASVVRTHLFSQFSISSMDSGKSYSITPYNAMFGGSVQFYVDMASDTAGGVNKKIDHIAIKFAPYFSITTIDPKDYNNYDSLFAKSYETPNLTTSAQQHLPSHTLPTTISGIGGKVELEIGNLCIFVDTKYVINSNTYLKYTNFNAFNWTIGTHIYTNILKFSPKKRS